MDYKNEEPKKLADTSHDFYTLLGTLFFNFLGRVFILKL